ncbi:gem-associated protein 6-like [Actinia tenebrosa]|uniref:Gem-associated protein 6-like n=1 Tax=Actinia tenebrosa TaxID=6105 RepID=A0A6P8J0Q0_ACTTE|nr:gem-associated protein 6-like [Actinia tenebrosa]
MAADDDFTKLSPTTLQKFVDKKVTITLIDDRRIVGWVYTIDPVTYCVVVVPVKDVISSKDVLNKTSYSVMFLMGDAVNSIHIDQDDPLLEKPNFKETFQPTNSRIYSEDELVQRKSKLKEWLKKNRIPVEGTDNGVLCVMGVLWIDSPYEADCCRCTNEIVLNRVQTLIRNLPDVS